jgi:hypothetical protein
MISSKRHCGGRLTVATLFAFGMLTTASYGYTMEQQEMCSGDAMRLCSSEIPNVARITACMEQKRDELSDGCRAVFEVDTAAVAETPADATPAARPSRPINLIPRLRHD